jgi:hypothetical protein
MIARWSKHVHTQEYFNDSEVKRSICAWLGQMSYKQKVDIVKYSCMNTCY